MDPNMIKTLMLDQGLFDNLVSSTCKIGKSTNALKKLISGYKTTKNVASSLYDLVESPSYYNTQGIYKY